MMPLDCPIEQKTCRLNDLSQDMVLTLRELREDLKSCHLCPLYGKCHILMRFNSSVQIAIQEVIDEWDLSADYADR